MDEKKEESKLDAQLKLLGAIDATIKTTPNAENKKYVSLLNCMGQRINCVSFLIDVDV